MRRACRTVVLLLTLGWAACDPRPRDPIRLGLSLWPPYEHFRLAALTDSTGGMEAFRLVSFFSPLDARRAFQLGQLDALCCTVSEALHILDSGVCDPVVCYVIDTSTGSDMLLGPDSLQTLDGLRGMRVGVESGTVGEVLLAGALREAGLAPSDIIRVPIHLQLANEPLEEIGLDAVVCFPPFSSAWQTRGGVKSLYDSSRLPRPLLDVLLVDRQLVRTRSGDLAHLVKEHQRIGGLRSQRGEWADSVMAAWERVSVEEFRATYLGLTLHSLPEQAHLMGAVLPASLEESRILLEWYLGRPFDVARLSLDTTIVAKALHGTGHEQ